MSGYNLYQTLHLDRSRAPQQLADDLRSRLATTNPGTPEYHELQTALAVLGDATKRTMYDRRLDSPTDDVTIPELRELATMRVPGAPGGQTGGSLKDSVRRHPKAALTAGAVAAVAVVAVIGVVAVNAFGGDGKKTVDDLDPDNPNYLAQREYLGYEFASVGDEVQVDQDGDGTADYTLKIENPQVLNTGSYPEHIMCYESVRTVSEDVIQRIRSASDFEYERSSVGENPSSSGSASQRQSQREQEYSALDSKYGLPAGTAEDGYSASSIDELKNGLGISPSSSYSQLAQDDPRSSTSGSVDENLREALQEASYGSFRSRAVMNGDYLSEKLDSDNVSRPAALTNELKQKQAADPLGTVRKMTCVNADPADPSASPHSTGRTRSHVNGYAVALGDDDIRLLDRDATTFGGWKFDK
jgi:hypothetical protein